MGLEARDEIFSETSKSASGLDLGDSAVDDVQECLADEASASCPW